MMNETEIAGPVMLPAVEAVTVKIPAPTTTATPKTVRSHQVRSLRSRVLGSSVSSIDCSTDLTRQSTDTTAPFPGPAIRDPRVLCTRWRRTYKHAIVVGASLAGLCAARVLSDVASE